MDCANAGSAWARESKTVSSDVAPQFPHKFLLWGYVLYSISYVLFFSDLVLIFIIAIDIKLEQLLLKAEYFLFYISCDDVVGLPSNATRRGVVYVIGNGYFDLKCLSVLR